MERQSTEWEVIVLVVQIVVMNETVLGMRSLLRAKKNAVERKNEGQRADEASPARCRRFGFGKRRKSVRRHITRVCATAEEGKEDGDQGENFRGKEKSPQHLVLGLTTRPTNR